MNKILQIIDILTSAILLYVVVVALFLLLIALFDYETCNWLVALSSVFIAIVAIGVMYFEHDADSNVMIEYAYQLRKTTNGQL